MEGAALWQFSRTFPFSVFPALTPLLPVLNTAPFLGGLQDLRSQLREMLVNRSSLPVSAVQQRQFILRAYRCTVAKIQMHQSFAACWQLRMQTASALGFPAGTVHSLFFRWEEWICWEWEVLWGLTVPVRQGTGAQLWEGCVVCYRVRFNGALLPLISGAVWESREEAGLKCQLCTGVGEFPSPGWDEVLSWWENLIRRAESSDEKSGSSCRWLGGIN